MYIPYLFSKKIKKDLVNNKEIIIILNNVQYARNLAECFQVASGFKIKKIILTGNCARPPFGKDLQKVSIGAEKHVDWVYEENISKLLRELKISGFKIIAHSFGQESKSIKETSFSSSKIVLLFGQESMGLSKELELQCDNLYYLPNKTKRAYLNLNVTITSVLTYIIFNIN